MRSADILRLSWRDWNPGLDNINWTLGGVLASLPAAPPTAIPRIIKLVENPSSPIALPGAITLARHDAIHVLIGRGLTNQDEAFVIGFTMGATKRLRRWQEWLFIAIATTLYPKPYTFSKRDAIAFRLGVAEGRHQKCTALEEIPFEDMRDMTLIDLRRKIGINAARLRAVYRWERKLIAGTRASRRLDVDVDGLDTTAVERPDGKPSDWKKERA